MSIRDRLPDISVTVNASVRLQADLGALLNAANLLDPSRNGSPLAVLFTTFGELNTRLDIDATPLTHGLTRVVQEVQNVLPANTLGYVESIQSAYSDVIEFLEANEIARQVRDGSTLNEVAQAVIAEALAIFDERVDELGAHLIDADTLARVRQALTLISQLETDFAAHRGEFLPFLSDHLIGVAPDLLAAPLAHVQSALNVLAPLGEATLIASLGPSRQAIMTAYRGLLTAIDNLDPANAADYAEIQLRLDALAAANDLLFPALRTLYGTLGDVLAAHAWDSIFTTYVDLLDALAFDRVTTLDDIVHLMERMLNDLLARFLMLFDADDLRTRVEMLNRSIRDAVLTSPLGQIRQTLQNFLERIRAAIAAVPTEEVQQLVNEMLGRVQAALNSLNLAQIQSEISEAFASVDTFVTANLNDALKGNVQTALTMLTSQLNNLPLAALLDDLAGAISQIQGLISELEAALQGEINALTDLLSQAESLSYRPVSDAVIGEIDDLKARLQAINPNALSDVEKLAIQGALAVLEAIDLENRVIVGLKSGYHTAEGEVKNLLNELTTALHQIGDKIIVFNPEMVLQPINQVLGELNGLLDQLNARTLLGGLYEQLTNMERTLQALTPGQLLDPLQEPYNALLGTVNRLDPTAWVAPLNVLYEQINRLISLIDITPVLTDLDQRQRALLTKVRNAILAAFDGLDLPEPLAGFFAQMRPVMELVTEAVFGDPDTELKQLSLTLREQVNLGTLFAPLDQAFLRLVQMLERVPADDLTTAMNAIRQGLGVGLEVLNPQTIMTQLRAGYGRLQEIAPGNLLAQTIALPALKANFARKAVTAPPERNGDVLAVSAKFDAVFSVASPTVSNSQLAQLTRQHDQLLNTLRRRTNALDSSTASYHYAQLRTNLEQLLPDFLRQPTSLTHADIVTGLYRMRPSTKAAGVEQILERFLHGLQPLAGAIEPAVNDFFTVLREIMQLINPLALRDSVEAIYATIRAKTMILDPGQLATAISALLDPVKQALQALNPAAIKEQINASFNNAVQAVTVAVRQILDELVSMVDGQLRTLRAGLKLILDGIKATIASALQGIQAIVQQVEDLVFVEILDRLVRVIDNLGISFDQELDRVRAAFDEMLGAIPLGGGGVSVGVSV